MKTPKHANSIIYIISLILPLVLTVTVILPSAISGLANDKLMRFGYGTYLLLNAINTVISFCLFMVIPLVTYTILYLVQIYRMWNVINDGKARMTPGEAIGYLFVPFYNLYWMFQVWGGFVTDYNAYLDRYRLQQKVPYLKRDLFDFLPILIILSGFIITIPILLIYFAVLLKRTNIAIDNLNFAVTEARRQQISSQPIQVPVFQPQTSFSN
jgi:hypothetical protein